MRHSVAELTDHPAVSAANIERIGGRRGDEVKRLQAVVDVVIPTILPDADPVPPLRRHHSQPYPTARSKHPRMPGGASRSLINLEPAIVDVSQVSLHPDVMPIWREPTDSTTVVRCCRSGLILGEAREPD